LIAVTRDAECGVDIEFERNHISGTEIAERFFCPREVEWLRRVESGFTRLWTMKEAIMKAVGLGLAIPLDAIDVTDVAEGRTSYIQLRTESREPRMLWLKELSLVTGYAASVAAAGEEHTIQLMGC
jgi:4'-phosphopantetheinyl transferase